MTFSNSDMPSPMDAFLDRVENSLLAAGVVRPVRASLLADLQADILKRVPTSGDAPRSPQDVALTLAQMGLAPGANGASASTPEWRKFLQSLTPQRSRCAFWGALCVAVSLLPVIAILVFFTFVSPAGMHIVADFPRDHVQTLIGSTGPEATTLFRATAPNGSNFAIISDASPFARFLWLFAPLGPLALAATLLGLFGLVDILRSKGKVTGLGAALFAMLFYPMLLGLMALWLW